MHESLLSCKIKSFINVVFGISLLGIITYLATASWKQMTIITVTFYGVYLIFSYCYELLWSRIFLDDKSRPENYEIINDKLKELGYMDDTKE